MDGEGDGWRWRWTEMDSGFQFMHWWHELHVKQELVRFVVARQNNHHMWTGERSKVVTLIKWQLVSVLGERECATNLMMMDCKGTCSRMSWRPFAECTVPLSGQVRDALRRRVYLQPSGRLRVVLCESRVGPFYHGKIWFMQELACSVVAKWGMILVLVLMLRPNNSIMQSHFLSLRQNYNPYRNYAWNYTIMRSYKRRVASYVLEINWIPAMRMQKHSSKCKTRSLQQWILFHGEAKIMFLQTEWKNWVIASHAASGTNYSQTTAYTYKRRVASYVQEINWMPSKSNWIWLNLAESPSKSTANHGKRSHRIPWRPSQERHKARKNNVASGTNYSRMMAYTSISMEKSY